LNYDWITIGDLLGHYFLVLISHVADQRLRVFLFRRLSILSVSQLFGPKESTRVTTRASVIVGKKKIIVSVTKPYGDKFVNAYGNWQLFFSRFRRKRNIHFNHTSIIIQQCFNHSYRARKGANHTTIILRSYLNHTSIILQSYFNHC
jgi:hypothetical protein